MESIVKENNTISTLTAGQSYIKDNSIEELGYEEAIKDSLKELDGYFEGTDEISVGILLDLPIYPRNAELYDDFTDDYGFYEDEFISYLIKRSSGKFEFDYKGTIIKRKKIKKEASVGSRGTSNSSSTFDLSDWTRQPNETGKVIDTIITIDGKLEPINERNLDELNHIAELDHRDLFDGHANKFPGFENITIKDIIDYYKKLASNS